MSSLKSAEMLAELLRREKEANIKPDPDLDIFMKVIMTILCSCSCSCSSVGLEYKLNIHLPKHPNFRETIYILILNVCMYIYLRCVGIRNQP